MERKQQKYDIRQLLKKRRSIIAANGYNTVAGDSVVRKITALDEFASADTVLMFYPVGSEINIISLFAKSKLLNKRVAFPCSLKGGILVFREVNDLSELGATVYNIPEPTETSPIIEDFDNSICITPALAFDNDGFRIGYGGGYYDRFLSSFKGISVGVAYDDMICDRLPRDEFDLPTDIIITERRIIRRESKSKKR